MGGFVGGCGVGRAPWTAVVAGFPAFETELSWTVGKVGAGVAGLAESVPSVRAWLKGDVKVCDTHGRKCYGM